MVHRDSPFLVLFPVQGKTHHCGIRQKRSPIMSIRIDYKTVAPAGYKALSGVYGYVRQSGLNDILVDLVYLRVSQINGCAYCLDQHSRDLAGKGVRPEKLALVQAWRESGAVFDERERAALAWAETVTRVAETAIPDEAFRAVSQVFGEKEIVDLTIAIGLMNTFNPMSIGFRQPPKAAVSS
jgi:AhpD family alkylhydroperoxidase